MIPTSPAPSDLPRPRMDRRAAIKWMLAAVATVAVLDRNAVAGDAAQPVVANAKGYGTDPDLVKDYKPGDVWPLTFSEAQRRTAAALCDLIIPGDEVSPAPSSLGVHDFIDEWISAPYPGHDEDKVIVMDGLAWLDVESQRRFKHNFADLPSSDAESLCSDISYVAKAPAPLKSGARFFAKFRDLTAGGFYTTKEGMKDIGYIGNMPLASFDGPPAEVLKKIGLA